ncbi:DUF1559 family PulG-like putative transporter [Allorhodopirellula solitaria]|uniref:DUF1559 domain-containing protein n=1 Tax=Allorhodopirellula solitaria TaxID=2527987 RepID=A0A5C5XWJ0_9BACT|nr:hypothetical protein CA85_28710 [Allorhodopirellula solitaria]
MLRHGVDFHLPPLAYEEDVYFAECDAIGEDPELIRARRQFASLGSEWLFSSIGISRMIAVFPRMTVNCTNGNVFSEGLYAPSSNHSAGFHSGFADGSAKTLSESIDANVWRALGSAQGKEIMKL